MSKHYKYLLGAGLLLIAATAGAENSIDSAMRSFSSAGQVINDKLVPLGMKTAVAAVTLQMIFSHWKDLFNGDFSSTLAKMVGIIAWFSGSIMLLGNTHLLSTAYAGYLSLAGDVAGISASDFTPGAVVEAGKQILTAFNMAVLNTLGTGWTDIANNMQAISVMVIIELIIIASYFMIALSLFVASLEFWMMFAVAPLAFGLIPLSAFREQGTSPVKGVISLGLRILILGVVVAVTKQLTAEAVTMLESYKPIKDEVMLATFYSYLAGTFGCALMALSAGKIASSIASGSANFSGADAIKTGMSLAATAGAGGLIAGTVAKTAASAIGGTASAAGKAGAVAGKAMDGFRNIGAGGVSPASPSGASGALGGGLGGPVAQARPPLSGGSTGAQSDASFEGSGLGSSASEIRQASAGNAAGSGGAESAALASAPTAPATGTQQAAGTGGGSPAQPTLSSSGSSASGAGSPGNTEGDASPFHGATQPAISSAGSTGSGSSAHASSAGASGGLGGPAAQARPSLSGGSSTGAQSAAGSAAAGIGGTGTAAQPTSSGRVAGALDKIGKSVSSAARHNAQDSESVGVQIHLSKD